MIDDLQEKATQRVEYFLSKKLFTRKELSDILDISRVTLNKRLQASDWRRRELDIIFKETDLKYV